MKYYIYISDAKVDMLFPQVPHDIKQKVALEFKVDLKLLSASRRTETDTEDNRIARMETVVNYIRQSEEVGSVDEPEKYIEDTLLMRWGNYGLGFEDSPVVYFGGQTEKTIVGLGGSMKHLLGSGDSRAHSHSATPFLMAYLAKELGFRSPQDELAWERDHGQDFTVAVAVELATTQMRGPQQKVEFLARKLDYHPVTTYRELVPKETHALLATPIYVALAD